MLTIGSVLTRTPRRISKSSVFSHVIYSLRFVEMRSLILLFAQQLLVEVFFHISTGLFSSKLRKRRRAMHLPLRFWTLALRCHFTYRQHWCFGSPLLITSWSFLQSTLASEGETLPTWPPCFASSSLYNRKYRVLELATMFFRCNENIYQDRLVFFVLYFFPWISLYTVFLGWGEMLMLFLVRSPCFCFESKTGIINIFKLIQCFLSPQVCKIQNSPK